MSDRALIAEARQLAAESEWPVPDRMIRTRCSALMSVVRELADALEAAQRTLAEAERSRAANPERVLGEDAAGGNALGAVGDLCALCARVVRPRSVRRRLLGYLVLSRNPDSGRLQPHGRVHAEQEGAEDWQRHLESPVGPRIPIRPGTQFLVAELREPA